MPKFDPTRPLSWSQISCFLYDRDEWYERYVLCVRAEPNKEMIFGSKIGKRLETEPSFLPQIVRHGKMEHEFKVKFGNIFLIGYADTFCPFTFKKLGEYKTGKKPWTQKRVDDHGQIDMYLLMNLIQHKVKPEEVEIDLWWMPTVELGDFSIEFVQDIEKKIKRFSTKRTTRQVLDFGMKINKIFKEMEEYANSRLT